MAHDNPSTSTAEVDRRTLLTGAAAGLAAGLLSGQPADAQQNAQRVSVRGDAFAQTHQPKPLPFDSAKLNGLSQKLIDSHWNNNYGGAVRALNEMKQRITDAHGDRDGAEYVYNDLKLEHLMRTGSVVLHELYFANLGGNGKADAAAQTWLAAAFGGFDRWESEFRRIANGLGGGSGWVVLGYNHQFGTAENYWMADHTSSPAMTEPLLVMDMYEHSYHMDFGAAAAMYVDAFFNNINWEKVLERISALRA